MPTPRTANAWINFVTRRGAEIILEQGLTPETCTPADVKRAITAAHEEQQAFIRELIAGETERAQTIRTAALDDVYSRLAE